MLQSFIVGKITLGKDLHAKIAKVPSPDLIKPKSIDFSLHKITRDRVRTDWKEHKYASRRQLRVERMT